MGDLRERCCLYPAPLAHNGRCWGISFLATAISLEGASLISSKLRTHAGVWCIMNWRITHLSVLGSQFLEGAVADNFVLSLPARAHASQDAERRCWMYLRVWESVSSSEWEWD